MRLDRTLSIWACSLSLPRSIIPMEFSLGSIMTALTLTILQSQFLDHPFRSLVLGLLLVPLIYLAITEYLRKKSRIPSFNGPPGLPVIGNIADIKYNAAETYRQWAKTYGDVYQIQLGNIPVIVVNSAASARVIFGQFSQALSSRPTFYTFHKVSGYVSLRNGYLG